MDCIPPGSSVHGFLQARTLEWIDMPPAGDLLDPGIKPLHPLCLLHWQVDSLPVVPSEKPPWNSLGGSKSLNCVRNKDLIARPRPEKVGNMTLIPSVLLQLCPHPHQQITEPPAEGSWVQRRQSYHKIRPRTNISLHSRLSLLMWEDN